MSEKPQGLRAFYIDQLKTKILPFWLEHGMDCAFGGYLTCFEGSGTTLVSTDKYTWSQGRMVYVLSRLARMDIFNARERAGLLANARSGADFLLEHCLLPDGHCVFLMDRTGAHKTMDASPPDASIYADCFVAIGMSAYAVASGRTDIYRFAATLYADIVRRIASGVFHTAPYPAPAGYRHHGVPMIMLNVSQEFAQAAAVFCEEDRMFAMARAGEYAADILSTFVDGDGILREMKPLSGAHDDRHLIGRYVNPGHVLEDMWFLMEYALTAGRHDLIEVCAGIAKRTFTRGWDESYGGLLLFCDKDGGAPKGELSGAGHEPMLEKVTSDWGSKLWWVHSEALYTLLLFHRLTGDEDFLAMYEKTEDYAFRTFPDAPETGEWVQIRDRAGRPEGRVVALPVKDPFHILRNFLKIIELES